MRGRRPGRLGSRRRTASGRVGTGIDGAAGSRPAGHRQARDVVELLQTSLSLVLRLLALVGAARVSVRAGRAAPSGTPGWSGCRSGGRSEHVLDDDGRVDVGRQVGRAARRQVGGVAEVEQVEVELDRQVGVVAHVQVAGDLRVAADDLVDERVGQEHVEGVDEVVAGVRELGEHRLRAAAATRW